MKQDQIHASVVSTLLALMDGLDSRGQVNKESLGLVYSCRREGHIPTFRQLGCGIMVLI